MAEGLECICVTVSGDSPDCVVHGTRTRVMDVQARPERLDEVTSEQTVPITRPIAPSSLDERMRRFDGSAAANDPTRKSDAGRQDGIVPITRVRVRAVMKNVNEGWSKIDLRIQMTADGQVWPLGEFTVARRKSGEREAQELMAIGLLQNALQVDGCESSLHGGESQELSDGSVEYRYWATLSARLSVAIQPPTVGYPFVRVIGIK